MRKRWLTMVVILVMCVLQGSLALADQKGIVHGGWLLLREIIRANLTVIPMVYRRNKPEPCYKTFTAPLRTTAARVTLADSITLTPGTITAEQDGAGMTVHCLDRTLAEGLEDSRFVRRLQSMEKQEESHEV